MPTTAKNRAPRMTPNVVFRTTPPCKEKSPRAGTACASEGLLPTLAIPHPPCPGEFRGRAAYPPIARCLRDEDSARRRHPRARVPAAARLAGCRVPPHGQAAGPARGARGVLRLRADQLAAHDALPEELARAL